MELLQHLGELGHGYDIQVSKDVFIRTVRNNKEAITPYINSDIPCSICGRVDSSKFKPYFSLLHLAEAVGKTNEEKTELIRFILQEFNGSLNINKCGESQGDPVHIIHITCGSDNYEASMLIASYPGFDITELVHFDHGYNQRLIEGIMGKADPTKYKKTIGRKFRHVLYDSYNKDPVGTWRIMRVKQ